MGTEETQAVEAEVEEQIDIETAIQEVLKRALIANGLGRGLRECQKALEQGSVDLCLERGVKLFKVNKAKKLGEWAGLRKLDRDGKPRKVVSSSCVVIKNYGEESKYLTFLLNFMESHKEHK